MHYRHLTPAEEGFQEMLDFFITQHTSEEKIKNMEYRRLTEEGFEKAWEDIIKERESEFALKAQRLSIGKQELNLRNAISQGIEIGAGGDIMFSKDRRAGTVSMNYKIYLALINEKLLSDHPTIKKALLHYLPDGMVMVLLEPVLRRYKPVDISKTMEYFQIKKYIINYL